MVNFKDLETKGFVVVPSFLNDQENKKFQNDFDTQEFLGNKNYPIKSCSKDLLHYTFDKIKKILEDIRNTTSLTTDTLVSNGIYTDSSLKIYSWHQDHESFYSFQDVSQYLNFYIPVYKTSSNYSGLKVVPFDTLDKLAPTFSQQIKGRGAAVYKSFDNTTIGVSDETGEKYEADFNLDHICEAPVLNEGDLLILRGDVIHATQDSKTRRLAISIRCANGNGIISKSRLLSGCRTKQFYIQNNNNQYQRLLAAFGNQEQITILDYINSTHT